MSETNTMEENTLQTISNKGTGAGGANTNYYGKKFEEKTNNQERLLELGYVKNSFTKNYFKSLGKRGKWNICSVKLEKNSYCNYPRSKKFNLFKLLYIVQ